MTRIKFTHPSGKVLILADPIELSVHEFIERQRIRSRYIRSLRPPAPTWTMRLASLLAGELYYELRYHEDHVCGC